MARVNHKLVKKLLNEKRSKITDRQFFTSRVLAGHFEDMAAAQTRRYNYGRRVRVQLTWNPKSPDAAQTDNTTIHVNTGFPLVTKTKGRENQYQMVCGLFAHELGHVLYTDFLTSQTQANYMDMGRWYPETPALHTSADFANEKALWAYTKADPKNLAAVKTVSHHIANVLEDGYIENRMLNNFPGSLAFGLSTLRNKTWEEMGTVTDLKEYEEDGSCHIFESILEVMLSYVKFQNQMRRLLPLHPLFQNRIITAMLTLAGGRIGRYLHGRPAVCTDCHLGGCHFLLTVQPVAVGAVHFFLIWMIHHIAAAVFAFIDQGLFLPLCSLPGYQ